jgi:hypothetical protein
MEVKRCVCCDRNFEGEATVCSDCNSLSRYEQYSLWHQLSIRKELESIQSILYGLDQRVNELPDVLRG